MSTIFPTKPTNANTNPSEDDESRIEPEYGGHSYACALRCSLRPEAITECTCGDEPECDNPADEPDE